MPTPHHNISEIIISLKTWQVWQPFTTEKKQLGIYAYLLYKLSFILFNCVEHLTINDIKNLMQ